MQWWLIVRMSTFTGTRWCSNCSISHVFHATQWVQQKRGMAWPTMWHQVQSKRHDFAMHQTHYSPATSVYILRYWHVTARQKAATPRTHELLRRTAVRLGVGFNAAAGGGGGYTFVPLAMESYGRLGKEASGFLSKLGDIAAAGSRGVSKAAFVRAAQQLVRAGGRGFLPGSDVPVAENVDLRGGSVGWRCVAAVSFMIRDCCMVRLCGLL
jgi:hypothetical protein